MRPRAESPASELQRLDVMQFDHCPWVVRQNAWQTCHGYPSHGPYIATKAVNGRDPIPVCDSHPDCRCTIVAEHS